MGKEFNPSNPQASLKAGYVAKVVNIWDIKYDDTGKMISCTARYYDYSIKNDPIFTGTASNPVLAYYALLDSVAMKIGKVSIKQFGDKLKTSDKNQHYIKFWNEFKPEFEAYEDIKELILNAIRIHVEKNPDDQKYLYDGWNK